MWQEKSVICLLLKYRKGLYCLMDCKIILHFQIFFFINSVSWARLPFWVIRQAFLSFFYPLLLSSFLLILNYFYPFVPFCFLIHHFCVSIRRSPPSPCLHPLYASLADWQLYQLHHLSPLHTCSQISSKTSISNINPAWHLIMIYDMIMTLYFKKYTVPVLVSLATF